MLRNYGGPAVAPAEWEKLEYLNWKSGGDTNFAPLASANGELECRGFWDHGKPGKGGAWTANRQIAPTLARSTAALVPSFQRRADDPAGPRGGMLE